MEEGQEEHAPCILSFTIPSLKPLNTRSPPSSCTVGLMRVSNSSWISATTFSSAGLKKVVSLFRNAQTYYWTNILGEENKPGTAQVVAISKAQKIEGGAFWRQKNSVKKSHSAEKTRKGDPSLSSGSVGYV